MAFPTVDATITGTNNGANPVLGLPTPVSAGDLLVAFFCAQSSPSPHAWESPWVELGEVEAAVDSPPHTRCSVAYLDASGGETTVTVTMFSEPACWNIYRITGHEDPSIQAPSLTIVDRQNPNNVMNPPSHTPPGGAKDFLWICGGGRNNSNNSTAPPTNYTDLLSAEINLNVHIDTARRELNAASEDPDTFTILGTGKQVAWTLAVQSGSGGQKAFSSVAAKAAMLGIV